MAAEISSDGARLYYLILPLVFSSVVYGLVRCYQVRRFMIRMRKQGLPMPPYSWFAGHLLFVKSFMDRLPLDSLPHYCFTVMAFEIKKDLFYVDFWPFFPPLLALTSPFLITQVTAPDFTPIKPVHVADGFDALCGGTNLFTMSHSMWKKWRSTFNPGFSANSMLEQVPKLVQESRVFLECMRERVREQKMFKLEEATFRLTMDVIGLVTFDTHFDYQKADSALPNSFRKVVEWVSFGTEINPFKRWNPLRPLLIWYHGRIIDKYIHGELEKRLLERQISEDVSSGARKPGAAGIKSIAARALDKYISDTKGSNTTTLDPDFKAHATSQIRLFMIAGHDTTSSAMTYTYHSLYTNPECLARIRDEHDAVFGPDLAGAGRLLEENPVLLNKLHYTNAVIKETLRLYPPAGTIRAGAPDLFIVDEDGRKYPTAGCTILGFHQAIHRHPKLWPEPDRFIPERWLVGPEDPYYPPKGGWRPFEFGPRNCIGQTLAMAEIKTLLAMTVREFDITPAYDEWDALHPSKRIKTALGERAYQVEGGGGGAHPANRYPCRVRFRVGE